MATSVTIAILNYQRKETLRRVLERAVTQDWPDLDVLVVDNASTDGSVDMVRDDFPSVRVVRLETNIGCAARNAGVEHARGEIVLTVDNDVLLDTPADVRTVVDIFERHPAVACVNFQIRDASGQLSHRDWCHPRDWRRYAEETFTTDYVLEGASAVRRSAFRAVGGYWQPLFIGHEGLDLALRLVGAGWDLLYTPSVRVTHLVAPDVRPSSRIYYTFTRNAVWVSLRNRRPFDAAVSIGQDLGLMAFSALRAGHGRTFVRGLRDAVRGAAAAVATRQALDRRAYARMRAIRRLDPSVFQKIKRHVWERPI